MPIDADEHFYERADAHIHLSNDQLKDEEKGKVSASMMYATARFNAWLSASEHSYGELMAESRDEIIKYFVEQYRLALEENIDDYINNFDSYMGVTKNS